MSDSMITGTAAYRQRIAIPDDTVMEVRLEDVSRQDVAADIIAERSIPTEGRQVPLSFELPYDPSKIQPSHRYNVRVSLRSEGRLLFTTADAHLVITAGEPTDVTIMLVQVSGNDKPATEGGQQPDASLVNTYWKLLEADGQPAVVVDNKREAHIILQSDGQRVVGTSGCNRLTGTYDLTGDQLRFSPLGMTMMMCTDELMQQEQRLTGALQATTRCRVQAQVLELFAGERMVARFESRYL